MSSSSADRRPNQQRHNNAATVVRIRVDTNDDNDNVDEDPPADNNSDCASPQTIVDVSRRTISAAAANNGRDNSNDTNYNDDDFDDDVESPLLLPAPNAAPSPSKRSRKATSAKRTKRRPNAGAFEMRRTLRQHRGHIVGDRSAGGSMATLSSSRLYSPWTVFTLALVFFVLLYIPLFQQYRDGGLMYPIPGWDVNTTRDMVSYVWPDRRTTLIEPSRPLCDDEAAASPLLLLIVVCSSVANFEIRDAIRQTWANTTEFNYSFFQRAHASQRGHYLPINQPDWRNYTAPPSNDRPENADFRIRIVFLVGQLAPASSAAAPALSASRNETLARLHAEAERHDDIVQERFHDTYNNLTLKSVMMLKWTTDRCPADRLRYLMKCDDDTFVNVPNLVHVLLGGTIPVYNASAAEFDPDAIRSHRSPNRLRTDRRELLLGYRFCNSRPILNTNSKWYAPLYMFAGSAYPPYLSGTGYVMSLEVAERLYAVALRTPVFHLEDVYLTGMCARTAHVRPTNHPLFSYTAFKHGCEALGMITKHEMQAGDMRSAYALIRRAAEASAGGRAPVCAQADQREAALRKAKAALAAASSGAAAAAAAAARACA